MVATIAFLPDRLNAEPVVFRGFTTPEMGYAALIGAGIGLIIALMLMVGLHFTWPIVPTLMLVAPLLLIGIGGKFLVRFKRNKPNHYLYLRLQYNFSGLGLGDRRLILVDRRWSLKRSTRVRKGGR